MKEMTIPRMADRRFIVGSASPRLSVAPIKAVRLDMVVRPFRRRSLPVFRVVGMRKDYEYTCYCVVDRER